MSTVFITTETIVWIEVRKFLCRVEKIRLSRHRCRESGSSSSASHSCIQLYSLCKPSCNLRRILIARGVVVRDLPFPDEILKTFGFIPSCRGKTLIHGKLPLVAFGILIRGRNRSITQFWRITDNPCHDLKLIELLHGLQSAFYLYLVRGEGEDFPNRFIHWH